MYDAFLAERRARPEPVADRRMVLSAPCGTALAAAVFGPRDAERVLVFVHGSGTCGALGYHHLGAAIAATPGLAVIVPDMRGAWPLRRGARPCGGQRTGLGRSAGVARSCGASLSRRADPDRRAFRRGRGLPQSPASRPHRCAAGAGAAGPLPRVLSRAPMRRTPRTALPHAMPMPSCATSCPAGATGPRPRRSAFPFPGGSPRTTS